MASERQTSCYDATLVELTGNQPCGVLGKAAHRDVCRWRQSATRGLLGEAAGHWRCGLPSTTAGGRWGSCGHRSRWAPGQPGPLQDPFEMASEQGSQALFSCNVSLAPSTDKASVPAGNLFKGLPYSKISLS